MKGDPVSRYDAIGLAVVDPVTGTAVVVAATHAASAAGGALASAAIVTTQALAGAAVVTGTALVNVAAKTTAALSAAIDATTSALSAAATLTAQSFERSISFVVNKSGEAVAIPKGAKGPMFTGSSGFQFREGSGGSGLHERVTGVRIMDPNGKQGRRVNYMNAGDKIVDPKTGRTISQTDPRGHLPYREP